MADRYWVGSTGTWDASTTTHWSATSGGVGGASAPTAADPVIIDGNSGVGTITTSAALCRSLTVADAYTGGLTFNNASLALSVGDASGGSVYIGTGVTIALAGTSSAMSLVSTSNNGGVGWTVTTNGKSMPAYNQNAPGSKFTLQDNYTTANNFTITAGDFTATSRTIVCNRYSSSASGVRRVDTTGSTITANDTTANTVINYGTVTNLTLVGSSSTNYIIGTAAIATRTVALNNATHGSLTYTVANSPGILFIQPSSGGSSAISTINGGSGRNIQITSTRTLSFDTWNVNGVANGYNYLPTGSSGNYLSAPDSAALSITGDITIDAKVAPADWTPAGLQTLVSKWDTGTNQRSYLFGINADGTLQFQMSAAGTATTLSVPSTVATGLTDGTTKWVRVSWDADNGAAQNVTRFYTSPDGTTWTILGTAVTTATARTIFDSTNILEIGSLNIGTGNFFVGALYQVKVYNSDLQTTSGTAVFNANIAAKTVGANTFTESSANAATVTVNGVLAQAGDGRVALTASTPGSAATLSSSRLVSSDYLTVQDSTAAGYTPFYAGSHGVLVSGNTNWVAQAPSFVPKVMIM